MSTFLESLSIRGVRSYSPLKEDTQVISFSPLTLILGSNGSGKTTIIEALKFLMSGEEPPLSDSRRNFIHYPQKPLSRNVKSYAELELKFKSGTGHSCCAMREIFLPSGLKNATPSVQSRYKINNSGWKFINKQDEWGKTIVKFFDLPNSALINNVIMCHQENSQWPFADASTVKQILDKIFGCERYKKEIKYIDSEIKASKQMLEFKLSQLAKEREIAKQKKQFIIEKDELEAELSLSKSDIKRLEMNIEQMQADLTSLQNELKEAEQIERDFRFLSSKLVDLNLAKEKCIASLGSKLIDSKLFSKDDLVKKLEKLKESNQILQSRQQELTQKEKSLLAEIKDLTKLQASLTQSINSAKVLDLKFKETSQCLKEKLTNVIEKERLSIDDPTNCSTVIKLLEEHESKLHSMRQTLKQTERETSEKYQELTSDHNSLKNQSKSIEREITTLRKVSADILAQIERADPTSKDLMKVLNKLDKILLISQEIKDANLFKALESIAVESKKIIEAIIERNDKELVHSRNKLNDNQTMIDKDCDEIERLKKEQVVLDETIKITSERLGEAKEEEKKTLYKFMEFSQTAKEIARLIEQQQSESKKLAECNLDARYLELDEIQQNIESMNEYLEKNRLEVLNITETFNANNKDIADLESNIQYRTIDEEVVNLKNQTLQLDTKLKQTNLEKLIQKRNDLQVVHRLECEKRASMTTKISQLTNTIAKLTSDLLAYHSSYRNLALTNGKIACTRLVLQDLQKLKDCFEKSVTMFHNQMIEKINELLKLRWRQVYQGNDISSIELVAEKVLKGDKENYSYYIAVRKDSRRTKMREQSSAGQRALASVIIRMTLAELFVKDFAFIAFDEPTTNLDRANVLALADVIAKYVRKRHDKGVNIQWIIITHDEEFVKALSDDTSSQYYLVKKNDHGCSIINKEKNCFFPDSSQESSSS